MTTDGIDESLRLDFNGIDATTGGYLFEPMSSTELADVAMGKTAERAGQEREHLAELRFRVQNKDEAHFGVKQGIDATQLDQAGWGVIFPAVRPDSDEAREQAAILEALSPLLALRKAQTTTLGDRYKEYRGTLGYRPGESKQQYLARLGAGPGPADPDIVPYYLLIVASPQVIPYSIQYQIDVQYAVGRLHFDTIEEYGNYARSVVAAETAGLSLSRDIAFVGVANPDDPATQMSRKNLVGPLADLAEGWQDVPGWNVRRYLDGDATKANVSRLFGGPETPALLFSGSHGMGFPKDNPLQVRRQGALLLQDWPGPKQWRQAIGEDLYFSADDLRSDAGMLGLIAFNFACYGAGTPEFDDFSKQAFKQRKPIAERAFVSGLHRKMLSHPKGGALATIGHVERAWGYSFMWGTGSKGAQAAQLTVFESTLKALMKGMPVGLAVEYFNERYAEMAADLSVQLEELEYAPQALDAYALASMWTSSNDARGYAVIGDPAVRLVLADVGHEGQARDSIDISTSAPTTAKPASTPAVAPSETPLATLTADGTQTPPSEFRAAVMRMLDSLNQAIEVRTYLGRNADAQEGELLACTRISSDGSTDVMIPQRDGSIDAALWKLHLESVAQAQSARTETLKALLCAMSPHLDV
jgi:hypothetical protein